MIRFLLIFGFLYCNINSFAQSYNAELVNHEAVVGINNGKLKKDFLFEIRINNRAGEKYAKIAIPHSKLVKVKNLNALIKDANGRVVKNLRKGDIVEKSSISDFSFYEDVFVKEFTLRHNSYPYTLVYSYQIQESEFLYMDYWLPIIDEKVPTHSARLVLSIPSDYDISYKSSHVGNPKIDTLNNRVEYKWETSYTELVKSEAFSPPLLNFLPAVKIIPQDFLFDIKGSLADWTSFGNWQYHLLQGLSELPENEKRKIRELVRNVDDEKEKIKILYHYLQDETRYINVTIETGGLKPYPASYVAHNKYGDCKALTNYFKAVLDFVQIPSYYTKVNAGSQIKEIDKDFPSQQSNHVILYIPLKNEVVWLDCTSDGAFNYLGTPNQNRDAFVVDINNSSFVKTPSLQLGDVLDTRRIEINYDIKDAVIKFQNTYRGESYENFSHLDQSFNETDKSRIVRNFIVADGFQLGSFQFSNLDRDSAKIELAYDATSHSLYRHFGNDILVSNVPFSLPDLEKPESRKLPLQIDFPIFKIDTLIYEIPVGYRVHSSQDEYAVLNKYGEFKFNISKKADEVIVTKSILVNPGSYPVSEYADFYDFYHQVLEIESKTHLTLSKNINHD